MTSPNGIVLVKELTARKDSQNICVKVDKMWKQNVYGKPLAIENLEMIFVDKECITFEGPENAFHFVDLKKILNNHIVDNGCVDIIGYLTVCGDLELMDINDPMSCSSLCGGEYARQINDYVSDDNLTKNKIVIVVQYGRYKMWREKKSIQNGYFSTRLMLDSAENKTASIISLSKGTINSTHDESLNHFPIRTIEEIRDIDEVVTRSEVVDLDAAEGDEVPVAKPDEMWCKTCKTNPQFKVQITVIDGSGSTSFIMFDREAGDVDAFPQALEKLVGRKFAFKVEVADYNIKREW
nr:hypothetical protein [Tanacetum cinerariifolium]